MTPMREKNLTDTQMAKIWHRRPLSPPPIHLATVQAARWPSQMVARTAAGCILPIERLNSCGTVAMAPRSPSPLLELARRLVEEELAAGQRGWRRGRGNGGSTWRTRRQWWRAYTAKSGVPLGRSGAPHGSRGGNRGVSGCEGGTCPAAAAPCGSAGTLTGSGPPPPPPPPPPHTHHNWFQQPYAGLARCGGRPPLTYENQNVKIHIFSNRL